MDEVQKNFHRHYICRKYFECLIFIHYNAYGNILTPKFLNYGITFRVSFRIL